MNEEQIERVREIIQEIAYDDSISFDAAFKIAMGALRLHALDGPKGEGRAGGPPQAS